MAWRRSRVRMKSASTRSTSGLARAAAPVRLTRGADFTRQPHRDQVAEVAAFDQAQSSFMDQTAHRRAHAFAPNAHIVGEPQNRKAKTGLALEAAVAEKMRIDRAVEDREFEPRRENVFEFFTHF